jgi:GxxExxY protein
MPKKKIVLVGGGPACLMAADVLADQFDLTIYEQGKTIGRKFLVAGKGGFNLTNSAEKEQLIFYEGIQVGTRRADFTVEGKVIVELKAVIRLENVHLAQAKNYVVAYNFPIGLLINFGATSLEYKKIFNNR